MLESYSEVFTHALFIPLSRQSFKNIELKRFLPLERASHLGQHSLF